MNALLGYPNEILVHLPFRNRGGTTRASYGVLTVAGRVQHKNVCDASPKFKIHMDPKDFEQEGTKTS